MKAINLNTEMGESFGPYDIGFDEEMVKYISSANIACGFHAGDPMVIDKTVKLVSEHKVDVGAHPGLKDIQGFGKREINISPEEFKNDLIYQIGVMREFCKKYNVELVHVKSHGAMNEMSKNNKDYAQAMVDAVKAIDDNLIIVAFIGSKLHEICIKESVRFAAESYADRALYENGSVVPKEVEGGMIYDHEKVVQRVLKMVTEGKVTTIEGTEIAVSPDTICLQGDNREQVILAEKIFTNLKEYGISIESLKK